MKIGRLDIFSRGWRRTGAMIGGGWIVCALYRRVGPDYEECGVALCVRGRTWWLMIGPTGPWWGGRLHRAYRRWNSR